MKIKIFAAAVFLFLILSPGASKNQLVLIYTNSLNGHLDYCKCPSDPKGGLIKRSTEIKKLRALYNDPIVVETGDFFPADDDPLLSEYIARSYAHIKYDAVLFGDHEFLSGAETLMSYNRMLPFVWGNIEFIERDANESPRHKIKIFKRGGVTVGIAATLSQDVFRFVDKKIVSKIIIADQTETLQADVNALRKNGAQLIIVLSHSGYDTDLILAKRVNGIDIIVGGHSQTLLKEPVKAGSSLIVQAGTNGSRIGVLEIDFAEGKIKSYKNSFRLPDDKQPADDPVIRGFIKKYEKKIREDYKKMRFD